MTQTSIETLVYNLVYNNLVDNSPNSKFWEIVQQAKEMHKAEILSTYSEGSADGYYDYSNSNREKYYQEKFGSLNTKSYLKL
jgi:hypothetical protein